MKYMIKIWGGLMLMFLAYVFDGCKEEERIKYYDPDAPAPAAINQASVTVENFPGTSIIRYELPDDDNLLYVKAVYETAPGVIRESKASVYMDSLVLEGFSASGNYTAQLYSIGKNEKESEAVDITVSPDTPPVIAAFATFNLTASFGGVRGAYSNDSKSDLKAVLLIDTIGNGEFQQLRAYVSNSPNAVFNYNGLESVETDFAVYLQDRFGNRSDTAWFHGITPLFEEPIPNDHWTWYELLPSDLAIWAEMSAWRNSYAPWTMWDGNIAYNVWSNAYVGQTPATYSYTFPFSLTISLGGSYTLSRIIIHAWRMHGEYTGTAVKSFQVYGSNLDRPGDDIYGEDWVLLGDFEDEIPSGNATATQADRDYAVFDGKVFYIEENDLTPTNPFVPIKYFRFLFRGNWAGRTIGDPVSGTGGVSIAELRLFGKKSEDN